MHSNQLSPLCSPVFGLASLLEAVLGGVWPSKGCVLQRLQAVQRVSFDRVCPGLFTKNRANTASLRSRDPSVFLCLVCFAFVG